jgi:hypothetical protein
MMLDRSGGESNITILGKDMDAAYINMVRGLSVYPDVIARQHDLNCVHSNTRYRNHIGSRDLKSSN